MGGVGEDDEVALLDDSANVGKTALSTMASQRTTESFIMIRVATQKKKKKDPKKKLTTPTSNCGEGCQKMLVTLLALDKRMLTVGMILAMDGLFLMDRISRKIKKAVE